MVMSLREFKGTWSPDLYYGDADTVHYYDPETRDSDFYTALVDNKNVTPAGNTSTWRPHNMSITNITEADAYDPDTFYQVGDIATIDGAAYIALQQVIGISPLEDSTFYWKFVGGSATTPHASTHISGSDQLPVVTEIANGLMSPTLLASLTQIAANTEAALEAIPDETIMGNYSGGDQTMYALTVSQVLALLGLTPFQNITLDSALTGDGTTTAVATTSAIVARIASELAGQSNAIAPAVADIAALTALDTTSADDYPDKIICLVEAVGFIFRLDRNSSSTADGSTVIAPTTGVGRWFKISSAITDHEALTGLLGGAASDHYHLTQAELTFLQAIPSDVTSPYTAAQIKTLYESNADTNALTDTLLAKLTYLTVTGAIDLDTLAAAVSTNTVNIGTNTTAITSHLTNVANPHGVTAEQLGLDGVWAAQCNLTASSDPQVTDDETAGYGQLSVWINTGKVFMCLSAAEGSAVWVQLNGTAATTLAGNPASYFLNRANHTGTQLAATISDLAATIASAIAATSVTVHTDVTSAGSGAIITTAERAKLAAIEESATGDMTDVEIKTAYESNSDTNAFTDAYKAILDAYDVSGFMLTSVYDPNGVGDDCFDAANIIFSSGTSGISAANVNEAIVEVLSTCQPAGSDGDLQYNNNGVMGEVSANYADTTNILTFNNTTIKGNRSYSSTIGNISGTYTLATPDSATQFIATLTAAITSFAISTLAITSGQNSAVDHTFKLVINNASGYAFAWDSAIKFFNAEEPDLSVAGTHCLTFTYINNVWVGQYNGTIA